MIHSFIHIKSLLSYLNEFEEQRNDMKMLGEYVIDNIFEHKGNGTNTHSFDNLSLKEISEWNELVAYGREVTGKHKDNNFLEYGQMLTSMFAYKHNLPVGFQTPRSRYNGRCRTFYINNTEEHWYDYFRYPLMSKEQISPHINHLHECVDPGSVYDYISIPHIHEDNDYILYFINNDFNLNRLRKLLIILMKERMKLYSNEIDDEKQIMNELEYNELLIEYCRKLITSCKNYLEKQSKNSTILLTL